MYVYVIIILLPTLKAFYQTTQNTHDYFFLQVLQTSFVRPLKTLFFSSVRLGFSGICGRWFLSQNFPQTHCMYVIILFYINIDSEARVPR